MKYLKEYKSFNEDINFDWLKKFAYNFKHNWPNEYDKILEDIFDRVSEIFDMNSVEKWLGHTIPGDFYEGFIYKMEETDSENGYVEIKIARRSNWMIDISYEYKIWIDGEEISFNDTSIAKKFWNLFSNGLINKKKQEEKDKLDSIKNKFSHLKN